MLESARLGRVRSRSPGYPVVIATAVLTLTLIAVAWGFVCFLRGIHRLERLPLEQADAIVAFSGDPERLRQAVNLLAKGYGRRLLITGPNKRIVMALLWALEPDLFACCVELDPSSRNTIGDADATRRWATHNGFASMIVVTSNYHLPRAMLELDHALPRIRKLPYAVSGGLAEPNIWLGSPAPPGLLALEYAKYIVRRAWLGPLG
jgi:hypothetical protein